ncbi:high mobility group protein B1-like [Pundamilia nyererei]|uniref:High mobility group protein B1-like n=1 Tax=Pundamilia nyererei TaxID=303518 RepID=A0A9Y3VJV3_9CICH|nr:PREDICTED: high mobility group protein B1-like [Pundamilia nyererei]
MSPKEKGKFEDMAKQDKLRYEREMKNYVPPKGQKKKRFKDPNAPKRPPSAFFLFCADFRPKIKSENPGLSIGDTAKKLGEMWNSSSAEEKQPYEKKAAKLKEKYDKVIIQNDYHLVIFSPHRTDSACPIRYSKELAAANVRQPVPNTQNKHRRILAAERPRTDGAFRPIV